MIGSAVRNIPTDLLRSFVKAIDSGSFTRAAEMVGRTQSAVSLQIKRLEEVVGVRLFQRDAHNLQLTAQGRTFAQYARRMLALNDEVLALMQSPDVSGRVRLGALVVGQRLNLEVDLIARHVVHYLRSQDRP